MHSVLPPATTDIYTRKELMVKGAGKIALTCMTGISISRENYFSGNVIWNQSV